MKRFKRYCLNTALILTAFISILTAIMWVRGMNFSDHLSLRISSRSYLHVMSDSSLNVVYVRLASPIPSNEPRWSAGSHAVIPGHLPSFPPVVASVGGVHISPLFGTQYNLHIHWWFLELLLLTILSLRFLIGWSRRQRARLKARAFPVSDAGG